MNIRKQTLRAVLATVATAAVLTACDEVIVYSHYEHTHLTGWERNDTILFCIPSMSQPGRFDETLGVRINDTYPFTSISLIVEQRVYPGYRSRRDTIKCTLADENGIFRGPGVDLHQNTFQLGHIDLKRGDSLTVKVRHVMKRETLPGISDIGITLKATH